MEAAPGLFPPTSHAAPAPEVNATVPVASGKVHVLAAERFAEVIVPMEVAPLPGAGKIAILSELAVDDPKTAEPVVPMVVVTLVAAPVLKTSPPVPALMAVEAAPKPEPTVTTFATA